MTTHRRKEEQVKGWVRYVLDPLVAAEEAWYFMPASGAFARDGVPDFIGHVRGNFFSVETKRDDKETPRPNQLANLADIAYSGGASFLVFDTTTARDFKAWAADCAWTSDRSLAVRAADRFRQSGRARLSGVHALERQQDRDSDSNPR